MYVRVFYMKFMNLELFRLFGLCIFGLFWHFGLFRLLDFSDYLGFPDFWGFLDFTDFFGFLNFSDWASLTF